MQHRSLSLALAAGLLGWPLAACAPTARNEPIAAVRPDLGYRYASLPASAENSDSLFVLLAFSGGGLRSAAFSYGLLEQLAATEIVWEGERRRLLDEVDVISAVSGGSLTAAAYGLYRDEMFGFYEDFLHTDMEAALLARLAAPWNWPRLASAGYSRGDLLATYLDGLLFHGATFADLLARGKPLIQINATEMGQWVPFAFDQEAFDLLCSDLSTFPVARAVAASSALPGVFAPITLRSYVGTCGNDPLPAWARGALADPDVLARRFHLAEALAEYLDPLETRYVHLLDGGLADVLGLRGAIDAFEAGEGPWSLLDDVELGRVRKLVVIVADAQIHSEKAWGRLATVPGGRKLVDVAFHVLTTRYARETLRDTEDALEELADAVRDRCRGSVPATATVTAAPCDPDVYLIRLFPGGFADEAAQRRFNAIPTTLTLPAETTEWLRAAARVLLARSEDYRRLLRDLRPAAPPNRPS